MSVSQTAMALLKESLAASDDFRTWVGAGDVAAAKLRIHTTAVAAEATRPFCWIKVGSASTAELAAGGANDKFDGGGSVVVSFEAERTGTNEITEVEAFAATIEAIIDDVLAVSGTGGYLAIKRSEMIEGYGIEGAAEFDGDATKDKFCQAAFEIWY